MPVTDCTVLVLGAGASAPYGLPLGNELLRQVCRNLLKSVPTRRMLLDLGHTAEEIDTFTQELRLSGYESVDAFLAANPDFISVGKHAMVMALLPAEDPNRLLPPDLTDRNWYLRLMDYLDIDDNEKWGRNDLGIVTFNYDRSLEQWFTQTIAQRKDVSREQAWEFLQQRVRITHVHGDLGEFGGDIPYGSPLTVDVVHKSASRVKILSEAADSSPEFKMVRTWRENATRIYFLGFGFHRQNVERLGYCVPLTDGESSNQIITGTNQLRGNQWARTRTEILHDRWDEGLADHDVYDFVAIKGDFS